MQLITPESQILWTRAESVTDIRNQVKPYLPKMRQILDKHHGYGLSAPQVGLPYRFFITRIEGAKIVINPVVHESSQESWAAREGCLSFDGGTKFTSVTRSRFISFEWTDLKCHVHKKFFSDMEARILLHELDHLNGICIFPNETTPQV